MGNVKTVMTDDEVRRTIDRLAFQVIENHGECGNLVLVGIQRRGVNIAARVGAVLKEQLGRKVDFGSLDINLYRDDWTTLDVQPMINETDIPSGVDGKTLLLVDDVLFTGRTIRAALEAVLDYGRPSRIELMVLVDRGHRELPIQANYVGKQIGTARNEQVDVLIEEIDGCDSVLLQRAD
ncbi:bifunctional pyr operon transcriptional regulator/uracil phosphoribosyltransferase PyrR [Halodesulfovibrio sp.]|jgi:pyrimidine operon attenuation protein/uracil phosphoribosyltransferase|uniref:bifunctional pyr operon transcriptional regulator/uracil phosphoribosyltransferase PyrR n=1 Tax=Halodesulfovibrio sp. TaxID=1912772 RepID=UPI0025F621EB|nr:bifunctional pyr operon transcriptional regulator/uracil phosphoribosyltransferase PyrR [Halodesulfovibrio sp.]MCT4534980.1 bifunctional pyr operon transcriptional regulator/uracil phosphoribosyltransferase PyrR [Halodesulfovibrio sp.]MCT4627529.1 bifunctional pyr operon transcriptional regulator/uracil phosphoribosyltransferase PyrR [Halodesulfovibrio sp.]